jgi:CheY-like chemotaxis protein
MTVSKGLKGRLLLVVEDEYMLALEMGASLEEFGAVVLGPVGDIDDALDLIDETPTIDGAVLDLNIRGEMSFPVADALLERGIPIVFATGYDKSHIPSRYAHITRCEKPIAPAYVAKALFG